MTKKAVTKKEFLFVEELAERFGVTQDTLRKWRVDGKGPHFIRGRPVRYPMNEIEKWENNRTVGSTSASFKGDKKG